jgi:hypothetical protein
LASRVTEDGSGGRVDFEPHAGWLRRFSVKQYDRTESQADNE